MAIAYNALIDTQLALDRVLPRAGADLEEGLEDLTLLIKTFERPRSLRRLLESVRRTYPSLSILVVDDSLEPRPEPEVDTLICSYDVGLSAGRNAGLRRIRTPFFLLCDDDFVFSSRTRLAPTLRRMRAYPALDIVGGARIDLPTYRVHDTSMWTVPGGHPRARGELGGLPRRAMVANFFMGRTERVLELGWDPTLKLLEHRDFFARARSTLNVVEDRSLRVLHAQTPFDERYMKHRRDVARYQARLALKWELPARNRRAQAPHTQG